MGAAVWAGPVGRMVAEGVASGTALGAVTLGAKGVSTAGAAVVAAWVGADVGWPGPQPASSSVARHSTSNLPGAMHLEGALHLVAGRQMTDAM